jgi:hypothetical protein
MQGNILAMGSVPMVDSVIVISVTITFSSPQLGLLLYR